VSSTFIEQYADLEKRFQTEAGAEASIFLPNIPPAAPVDFVFIAMEPSLKSWSTSREDAQAQIVAGFRNFLFSVEDFILHFCIRSYLCRPGETYHLTDLTKGAMLVTRARKNREERYDRWYPLLLEELAIVAKPSARIYTIGGAVDEYLRGKRLDRPTARLLHYSGQAARYREKAVRGREWEFEHFSQTLRFDAILEVAEEVMLEAGLPSEMITQTMARLCRHKLTDSRKKLVYTYNVNFSKQG
jgi:hypothetical protein